MGVELTEEIVAEYKKLGKESKKSRKKRQKIK